MTSEKCRATITGRLRDGGRLIAGVYADVEKGFEIELRDCLREAFAQVWCLRLDAIDVRIDHGEV